MMKCQDVLGNASALVSNGEVGHGDVDVLSINQTRPDVPFYKIGEKRHYWLPDIVIQSIRVSNSVGLSKDFDFTHPYIGIVVWDSVYKFYVIGTSRV